MQRNPRLALATTIAMLSAPALNAATLKTLYKFQSGTDGQDPVSDLLYLNGILYGTTGSGGTQSGGTIFTFNPSTRQEAILYNFPPGSFVYPVGSLTPVGTTLYGVTSEGGGSECGNVYKINATTGAEADVYDFTCGNDGGLPVSGAAPHAGSLYGTAETGGTANNGVIYKIDLQTGIESVLHNFTGGADGGFPVGGLLYKNGAFWGSTAFGGSAPNAFGTIFKFDPATNVESVVYNFNNSGDGAAPRSTPIYEAGTFYYLADYGIGTPNCSSGCGALIKISASTGAESVVYTFQGGSDGSYPSHRLAYKAGAIYGTTYNGGTAGLGTIFKIGLSTGTKTILHSFTGPDGVSPGSGLTLNRLTFFGVTTYGPTGGQGQNLGTIFKFLP